MMTLGLIQQHKAVPQQGLHMCSSSWVSRGGRRTVSCFSELWAVSHVTVHDAVLFRSRECQQHSPYQYISNNTSSTFTVTADTVQVMPQQNGRFGCVEPFKCTFKSTNVYSWLKVKVQDHLVNTFEVHHCFVHTGCTSFPTCCITAYLAQNVDMWNWPTPTRWDWQFNGKECLLLTLWQTLQASGLPVGKRNGNERWRTGRHPDHETLLSV